MPGQRIFVRLAIRGSSISGKPSDAYSPICATASTTSRARDRRISQRCRWAIAHAEQPLGELVPRGPFGASTSYRWAVPVQDVAARDIAAGYVVRLDDPQAQRVERAVHVDGRVVLELRPVGLEMSETSRVTLPNDRLVSRLGTAGE